MQRKKIDFVWIENGERHEKKIDREKLFETMDGIRKGFSDDNQISSKFCELIPEMISISINKDQNANKDVPMVFCEMVGETQDEIIEIIRHHKIIWSILDYYCKE